MSQEQRSRVGVRRGKVEITKCVIPTFPPRNGRLRRKEGAHEREAAPREGALKNNTRVRSGRVDKTLKIDS